jgi:hypothetical protein
VPAGRPHPVAAADPYAVLRSCPRENLEQTTGDRQWVGDAADKAACALLSRRQASELRDFKLRALRYKGVVVLS